jgi:hypothetical protein
MPAKKSTPDFRPVFLGLKKILAAHAGTLVVVHDTPTCYYLDTKQLHPRNKQPLMFGAVRLGKNYVSYHLMPVYGSASLRAAISPALKKRMQGNACFNFTEVNLALFAELAELTARGLKGFAKMNFA